LSAIAQASFYVAFFACRTWRAEALSFKANSFFAAAIVAVFVRAIYASPGTFAQADSFWRANSVA